MEKNMITGTIFMFLLFAVSAIALDPTGLTASTEPTTVTATEEASSEMVKITPNDQSPESEQTQTFVITTTTADPAPLRIFSRSLPIQRHSFDRTTRIPLRFVRSHPCRKFKKTLPAKMSYGNDMILSDKSYKTTSVDLEEISDPIPTKWLEFKHKYGHRHHHHHHDKDGKFEMKFENDGEKKTKEHKGGFMRRVRKFLKHTFD